MAIQFVHVPGIGLGRLKEALQDGSAEVVFLKTPGVPLESRVVTHWSHTDLQESDRVWISPDQNESNWVSGSIAAEIQEAERTFYVQIPNREMKAFPEERIWPRWDLPVEDPVAMLINHVGETPYLFNSRLGALTSFTLQQARIAGLRGLWSSQVELHEHQILTAHRILSDPVQRYLLADEVGLGKTIEAGLVIRQVLSQDRESRALVLVPDHLVNQWTTELSNKFYLSDYGDSRVDVVAHSQMSSITSSYDICAIDEVHRLVVHPSHATGEQLATYDLVRSISLSTPRLLLLTATPVRAGDIDYLAILHLLSPETHPLDAVDEFREKLKIRNEIAEIMIGFTSRMDPAFVPLVTGDLRELIPNDKTLHQLLDDIDEAVNAENEIERNIEAIRNRISNRYRLHSRLIRNRRIGKLLEDFPVRGRTLEKFIQFDYTTPDSEEVLFTLQKAISSRDMNEEQIATNFSRAIYFLSTGTWASEADRNDFTAEVGTEVSLALVDAASSDKTSDKRTEHIVELIKGLRASKGGSDLRKKVIFATSSEFADLLMIQLGKTFGAVNVFRANSDSPDEAIKTFRNSHGQTFLVCDSSLEEGVNLQFAEVVILADLPFSTRQLEQRIGRFDRYSTEFAPIQLIIPSTLTTVDQIWWEHVHNTGILTGSIAGLQYALGDHERSLFKTWAIQGSDLARTLASKTSETVEHELRELSKQDIIDTNEFGLLESDNYLHRLIEESRDSASLARSVTKYAADQKLKFERTGQDFFTLASNFKKNMPFSIRKANQYHLESWSNRGTFHRELALDSPGTRFFGLGYPLIDAIEASLGSNEKGCSSARRITTRRMPENTAFPFFDFNFVLSPDDSELEIRLAPLGLKVESARTLLNQWCPTVLRSLTLDINYQIPPDLILTIVHSQYEKSADDVNLCGSSFEEFLELTSRYKWSDTCRGAEESARLAIIDDEIHQLFLDRRANLESHLNEVRDLVVSRVEAGMDDQAVIETHDVFASTILTAVTQPRVTLDSVLVTFLSGPKS
jgi:ATP-dependent helicase HepA